MRGTKRRTTAGITGGNTPAITGGPARRLVVGAIFAVLTLATTGCGSADESVFVYRLPYTDGTEVDTWQDHLTHNLAVDLAGVDPSPPYPVVAARDGIIRFIEDQEDENCAPGDGCPNNYVWIEHSPGLEWTKYSHLATNSVSIIWAEGDTIDEGQVIGLESNIGQAAGSNDGRHLHFEVREVVDGSTPTSVTGALAGPRRAPRFCGVPNGVVVQGEQYIAEPCPG